MLSTELQRNRAAYELLLGLAQALGAKESAQQATKASQPAQLPDDSSWQPARDADPTARRAPLTLRAAQITQGGGYTNRPDMEDISRRLDLAQARYARELNNEKEMLR